MTFEAPIWLVLTPVITLLAIGLIAFGWRKRSRLLGQFAAARLLETLTEKASPLRRLLKAALIVAALAGLGLALARPQYGVEWSERKGRGLDIVFALDSSRSMLATDLRPSRLERAKLAILDLIDRLENDRVGLVAFAGQAFLQTPPTLDYGAFRESLKATDPSILSRGGSDLGRAIEEAAKAFPSERNVKVVLLLTDGEDQGGRAVATARSAAEAGIQIFTIGIGTPEGEYLRIRNPQGTEEFVRDASGQPVRSQLDESTLQEIAQLTSGTYTRLGSSSLEALYQSVLATLPREERRSELKEIPIERFQWLLAAALTFLVLEILLRSRRAGPATAQVSALLLAGLLLAPQSGEAKSLPYNEAYAALKGGDYAKANQLYTEAMQQTRDLSLQRDALYNMGHATYQLGRTAYESGDPKTGLEEIRAAEDLFAAALELDPTDAAIQEDLERTRTVREALEKLLEEQEQQQQEQQNQDQENGESSDQPDEAESQQSENQDQENSESESEASESQDGETGEEEQNQENQSGESGEEEAEQQDGESGEGDPTSEEAASDQEDPSEASTAQDQSDPDEAEENQTPEPRPGDEEETTGEESGESSAPVPQVEEAETAEPGEEAGAEAQSSTAVSIEGMTLQEAQDLLDSLRGKEEILPFTKPAPGKGQPLQDW